MARLNHSPGEKYDHQTQDVFHSGLSKNDLGVEGGSIETLCESADLPTQKANLVMFSNR
jgi:hypothetical protein